MITFNDESVQFLKELTVPKWYDILDRLFNHETLPDPISCKFEFISEYFIELNSVIANSSDSSFLNKFHDTLIRYYFDLPILEAYYSRIYTLHWVIGNIKPKVDIANKFYNQLYSEMLNGVYYEQIHLGSSLLSMIHELPSMYDDSAMVVYLFSSINRISDYSFFRVALRYFIEKRNIEEYWGYFYKIAHKYKNELFADVLTESLMDLRRYSGSCQKLYEKIDDTWNTYQENFPEIFVCITNNLNNKYLNSKYLGPNGKWKDDIYAKLLKAFINSTEYPPLPAILTEAWSKLENNKNREIYIRKLFKNRKWEKDTMHLDEISKNNYLITIGCVIFYQDTYGVKKEEITGNDPPVQLRNIINEYLYPDYYKCVYYKLKAA